MYSLFDDIFAFNRRPSVYVVSDSQLAEWKQKQAEREIVELDRLIDSHKQSIERLEETKVVLRKEYPKLEPSSDEKV